MLIALLAMTALTVADDPQGVVTTAPAGHQSVATDAVLPAPTEAPSASSQTITPHGLTTAEQIDRWVGQRDPSAKPFSQASAGGTGRWAGDSWGRVDDRKMHGEVSAAIGTGDFSEYSAAVSIPVGESARVDLEYRQTKNGYGQYGYPGAYPGYGRYGAYGYGRPFSAAGQSQSFSIGYSSDSSARDPYYR
ncbi:MAG TPA: hypothetical protein VF633_08625 [Brevundimonas sp.]|jgi:hypothetical protein